MQHSKIPELDKFHSKLVKVHGELTARQHGELTLIRHLLISCLLDNSEGAAKKQKRYTRLVNQLDEYIDMTYNL